MTINLKIANEEDKELWDSLIEKSPHGTIFHTWKFLEIMEKHTKIRFLGKDYDSKLYHLIAFKKDTPVGLYPIFYYNTPIIKYVFSPPLRTAVNYLGPLIIDYDRLKQSKRESLFVKFQKKVDEFMTSQLGVSIRKIKLSPGLNDARPLMWNGYDVKPLYNYEINLDRSLDEIWKSFSKDRRKGIKKTEKCRFNVLEGSKKEIEFIFKSVTERYLSQGVAPIVTKEYLLDVYDALYPNLRVFIIEKDNTYITGSIVLTYGKKVLGWFGSTKADTDSSHPNDLLQWEIIKWAHFEGYKIFEIVWANTYRLCRYKSRYNPTLSLYFTCEKYPPLILLLSLIKNRTWNKTLIENGVHQY